jgi:hypothetical protein
MTRFGTQVYPVNGSGEQPSVVVDADLPEVVIPQVEASLEDDTTGSNDDDAGANSDNETASPSDE